MFSTVPGARSFRSSMVTLTLPCLHSNRHPVSKIDHRHPTSPHVYTPLRGYWFSLTYPSTQSRFAIINGSITTTVSTIDTCWSWIYQKTSPPYLSLHCSSFLHEPACKCEDSSNIGLVRSSDPYRALSRSQQSRPAHVPLCRRCPQQLRSGPVRHTLAGLLLPDPLPPGSTVHEP